MVEIYGPDADKHLFRCLVSSVDFSTEGRNSGKDGQQLQLLMQEANTLITKPDFVSILCYAFESQDAKVSNFSYDTVAFKPSCLFFLDESEFATIPTDA